MIRKFLDSLEDPERPLMGPNFWIMQKLGIILPDNLLRRALAIATLELVTVFVLTQYVELYVVRYDIDEVQTNLKISMLSIVCIVKSNAFIFWQKNWREVMDYVTDADKYERDNCDDKVKKKIIDSYTIYSRRVSYFYWVLVFTTFVTVVSTPLIRISSSSFRAKVSNGTEKFPHVFSSWVPIDKYHFPGNWITIIWHTFMCAYGAMTMAAYDSNAVVIMVFFGGKLDLIRERCKQMLGSNGQGVSDKCALQAIRRMHKMHKLLIKYSRQFNSLLSPVMFLYVVMCSLMLCASAYQLTSATTTSQKVLMAEYLIFGISQVFVFCWHSNDVLVKSENLMKGPYESEWWAAPLQQRKTIHLLAGQFNKPCLFTAGPFTDLTLYTFITILKGAYSYYTLLRD